MANRLATSTSPYLLQHQDNPVDWQEWSQEAFAEAQRRDVPVLLSVGYAACHWCHVMAHESFEDEQVAQAVNRDFVAIKVDREERPDIDAVYMAATTALTGHGGWPMTVLPDARRRALLLRHVLPPPPLPPAAAGDPRDVGGAAGAGAADERVDRGPPQGDRRGPARADHRRGGPCAARCSGWPASSTRPAGGFGGAPKFPPSMVLEFLLRHHARTGSRRRARDGRADLRGDGAGRHVRPARRRVRAVSVDARLGGAALREDALRQRPAAAGLRAPAPRHRRRRSHAGSPLETAEFLLRDLGTARAASPRRSTPTRTASRV